MKFREGEDGETKAVLTTEERIKAANNATIETIEALSKIGHVVKSIGPYEDDHNLLRILVQPAVKTKTFYESL